MTDHHGAGERRMPADDDHRVSALQEDLREVLGLPAARVEPWRSGTDFWADLAHDGPQLLGVVRSPRTEHLRTSYDGLVDYGEVLDKEAAATTLLQGSCRSRGCCECIERIPPTECRGAWPRSSSPRRTSRWHRCCPSWAS